MIQTSPSSTIFVVNEPVSFQCRIKGMVALCRDILAVEPMSGAYFVFRNSSGQMLRVLFYDGDGFWLCEKRFSKGKVRSWFNSDGALTLISARELAVLLWHGDLNTSSFPAFWKAVPTA